MDGSRNRDSDLAPVQSRIEAHGKSWAPSAERARLHGACAKDLVFAVISFARRAATGNGKFDPHMVAPGLLDPRVLDRHVWWVDVPGSLGTLRRLSDEWSARASDAQWLNATALMRALRAGTARRQRRLPARSRKPRPRA